MESRIELIAITSSMSRVKPKDQSPAFKAYFKEVSDKLDDYMKPEVRKRIDNIIEKLNCESHCNHDFKQMNDQAFGEIDKCVKCGIIKW